MDNPLSFLTGLISGPGAYGDPRETFKMYAPPNLLDYYTPEQQTAYGQQIQSQMRSPWSSARPDFAQVQAGLAHSLKTGIDIAKTNRELALDTDIQNIASRNFAGMVPNPNAPPPSVALTPQANADRAQVMAGGQFDRKKAAMALFNTAVYANTKNRPDLAEKYLKQGLDLHPNPSEAIRDIEYLFGNSLAGSGSTGFENLKAYNESKSSKVNVNTGINKGEEAYWSELGKNLPALESQAMSANRTNESLATLIDLGNKKTFTGGLAPGAIGATQFLSSIGLNVKPETLANTREFQAQSNILVLDFMGAMGGARGFSKEESAILYDAFPKIVDSPQARERIATMLIARNNRIIRDYNTTRDQFEKGVGKSLASPRILPYERANPSGANPSAPSVPTYDPKTGKWSNN